MEKRIEEVLKFKTMQERFDYINKTKQEKFNSNGLRQEKDIRPSEGSDSKK